MFANMACQSIEVIEGENPLQVVSYEFLTDRAGPGQFRGGAPYRREYEFLEREAVLQVRSDRRDFRPYGLYRGQPGRASLNILNPDGEARVLDSKLIMNLARGDVFRHELAGGGGWGDPLERDPARVLEDARNGFVSCDGAKSDYGVVIRTDGWEVDESATLERRRRMRSARGDAPADSVSREEEAYGLAAP